MRILLGLARPTSGRATINGQPYTELRDPLRHVGALLDPNEFHPGRSGRNALRIVAGPARIPAARVDKVLDLVGLTEAAVVIHHGRPVAAGPMAELVGRASASSLEDFFLEATLTQQGSPS